jgi:uncharacterized protein (TIGR03643 family)
MNDSLRDDTSHFNYPNTVESIGFRYQAMQTPNLDNQTIDRIIEMAWEDRTPFEAIEAQFGLQEKQFIAVMRRFMSASSFKMWRKRVTGRKTNLDYS